MSKLLNQITKSEYDMIDYYRTVYADVDSTKMIPAKDLLSVWEMNKEEFLGKIFKHSLILEKPVEVAAPEGQLEAEMYETFWAITVIGIMRQIQRKGEQLILSVI